VLALVRSAFLGAALLAGSSLPAMAATVALASPAPGAVAAGRNDYANPEFSAALGAGMRAFYTRDFATASEKFGAALAIVPDNTLAISFLNASAAQVPGELDKLIAAEEDALLKNPKSYNAHLRLGFSYLFSGQTGRNRDVDAREELNTAAGLDPKAAGAHVGLGIMREAERSANRAKVEFLAALESDKNNVLAREYLALIYQVDLKDPQRGLAYVIDVPNMVPEYADMDFHLASILHDLKQAPAAITYATRGLEIDVGHVGEAGQHGYTLLARIYIDEKQLDDARRVLKASITANTDVTYANTLLQKINNGDYGTPGPASPAPKKK
jgi:tetratricopeptide (TPR) repeat protein